MIALADCQDRQVYRVQTRNLDPLCVFSAEQKGFFGIRTKFGNRFLDVEFHFDYHGPHGTARPLELVTPSEAMDEHVRLMSTYPPVCEYCGIAVEWTGKPGTPAPWLHIAPTTCMDASPLSHSNLPLRRFLDAINYEDAKRHGVMTLSNRMAAFDRLIGEGGLAEIKPAWEKLHRVLRAGRRDSEEL